MKDFISKHKILVVIAVVILLFILILVAARQKNMAKKTAEQNSSVATTSVAQNSYTQLVEDEVNTQSEYERQLGLGANRSDGRVTITDEVKNKQEEERRKQEEEAKRRTEPLYDVYSRTYDSQPIYGPSSRVDNDAFRTYCSHINLGVTGSFWGDKLTEADWEPSQKIMVGVTQNPANTEGGDLQSVGWLMNNLGNLASNTCIKFADLHVVQNISNDNHVAVISIYSPYSAYNYKDIIVVFEDISGTLNQANFKEGDIFEALVFAHNIKVQNLDDTRILKVEYATFEKR